MDLRLKTLREKVLKNGWFAVTALLSAVIVTTGCVAVRSFPMSARAGDTITLAVGSPDGMTPTNTTVSYTPSGGSPIPLTIRSIFKLYPDKTSPAWLGSSAIGVENDTGHGPWTTIIAADIPSEYPAGVPVPTGSGDIQVSTSAVYPPPPARNINDTLIPLEILPGTGAPDPFEYEIVAGLPVAGDLSQLEPERRIVVKPQFTGVGASGYGAIEVTLTIPYLDVIVDDVRVVIDDKMRLSAFDRKINYIWSIQGSDLVVSFMSPTGGLDYSHVNFYILSPNLMDLVDIGLVDPAALSPTVTYYDVDGNVAAGGYTFEIIDET
jgi:hypothetical protein